MKLKVFISSTSDLYDWRGTFARIVKSLGHQEILWEHGHLAGRSATAEEDCYREVRESHVLIAIAGTSYGSKSAKYVFNSVFQGEVLEAREAGVPIIFFQSEQLVHALRTKTRLEPGVIKFDMWCRNHKSPPMIMMPLKNEEQVLEAVSNQLSAIFANLVDERKVRTKRIHIARKSSVATKANSPLTQGGISALLVNASKIDIEPYKNPSSSGSNSGFGTLLDTFKSTKPDQRR